MGCSYESNKFFGLMIVRAILIARSPSKWPEGLCLKKKPSGNNTSGEKECVVTAKAMTCCCTSSSAALANLRGGQSITKRRTEFQKGRDLQWEEVVDIKIRNIENRFGYLSRGLAKRVQHLSATVHFSRPSTGSMFSSMGNTPCTPPASRFHTG